MEESYSDEWLCHGLPAAAKGTKKRRTLEAAIDEARGSSSTGGAGAFGSAFEAEA